MLKKKLIPSIERFLGAGVSLFYNSVAFLVKKPSEKNTQLSSIALADMRRVLVVRLDEIGDFVMTTPFLRELRRNLPRGAKITLVVNPITSNLAEGCPYVDKVLSFKSSPAYWLRILQSPIQCWLWARKYLWKEHFDLAVLPRWDVDNRHARFIAYFSNATFRVGHCENTTVEKSYYNKGANRLFTHVPDDTTLKHEVQHNLDILRFLGGTVQEDRLELWGHPEDHAFAEAVLHKHHQTKRKLIFCFCPGAAFPKRMWPLDHFAELGNRLTRQYQSSLLILGSDKEESLGAMLQQRIGDAVINMAGRTTLRQAFCLLQRCHAYIGNDTGPAHLAAAAGIPVVVLSCHPKDGSSWSVNAPERIRPWTKDSFVIQPQTFLASCKDECTAKKAHCIAAIKVDQVKQVVENLMASNAKH